MADQARSKKEIELSVAARITGLNNRIDRLEAAVDNLKQLNRSLWQMLRAKVDLDEEDLKARIRAMREEAEANRGKVKPAVPCPKCGRPLDRGRDTCAYCGTPHAEGDVFDGVL